MQNIQKHIMRKMHSRKAGFEVAFEGAHFNEIVVKLNKPVKEINQNY